MTTNPLERAVIEAARSMVQLDRDAGVPPAGMRELRVHEAIKALEAWEATQDPEVREIGWHEVAEGDLLKSVKTGKFYPVLSVIKVKGGHRIVIQAGDKQPGIIRPTPQEPSAFVKRGQAGAAVDMFVNVFSSRGK